MHLQAECRKAIQELLQKDGMPPITEKNYGSIWDSFIKTQPTLFGRQPKEVVETDIWGNLQMSMVKYWVPAGVAKKVISRMQKKFGDKPSFEEIKMMIYQQTVG